MYYDDYISIVFRLEGYMSTWNYWKNAKVS